MMLDTQTLLNPYPMFRELRETSPVLYSEALDFWLVFRYDDVKRAYEDAEAFSSENPLKLPSDAPGSENMAAHDDPDHARLRAIAQPAFTPRRVAKLEQQIKQLCDALLDGAARQGDAFDIVSVFTGPLPAQVIAELLGVPTSDMRMFQQLANEFLLIATKEHFARGQEAEKQLGEYYGNLLHERQRSGTFGDDLTGDILRAHAANNEAISDREMVAMGLIFLIAGHETTTNLLNNTIRSLSESPDAQAFLLADLARAPMIIDEVLRHRSPVMGAPRLARHDVALSGVTIPAQSRVLPLIASANRDPRAFDDPERFIPDRNAKNILTFGRGVHRCIGEPLARLEAKIAVPALYKRFPHLRVDPERPAVPSQSPIINGCLELPVRV